MAAVSIEFSFAYTTLLLRGVCVRACVYVRAYVCAQSIIIWTDTDPTNMSTA